METAIDIEKEYVQKVYRYLASLPDANSSQNATKKPVIRWINVQKFINQLPLGTIVIDIGCGKAKYHRSDCFFMDCDICLEILAQQLRLPPMVDLQLADALNLPYRSKSIDAALLVSVLHHFTTLDRRKRVLFEVARCLRSRGQVLIYVWAFEQPNGKFPSQDVLVPCAPYQCNSISPNGHSISRVKFHMDSTKEERLIRDSIAMNFLEENTTQTAHMSLFHRICKVFTSFQILSRDSGSTILNKCTTKSYLSTRYKAVERFSAEFAERTINMALAEVLCIKQQYNSYRFYHVFKKDELKVLIAMVPSLRLLHLDYEHGNWWAVAEKADSFS